MRVDTRELRRVYIAAKTMTHNEIVEWYATWKPDQGIDELIEKRQLLSIEMVRLSQQIGKLERKHAQLYTERKFEYAVKFLGYESGTGADRKEMATRDTKEIAYAESTASGELRGLKIYHESCNKVLDSMAAWISRERRL